VSRKHLAETKHSIEAPRDRYNRYDRDRERDYDCDDRYSHRRDRDDRRSSYDRYQGYRDIDYANEDYDGKDDFDLSALVQHLLTSTNIRQLLSRVGSVPSKQRRG